jgi:hypothetical protein
MSNSGPIDGDGNFAAAVIKLYNHARSGARPFDGNASDDVRRVAFGLALIRDLVEEHARTITFSAHIPSSAIGEALSIIEHLTTGREHPVSRHIRGIHSGRFRPQHASVTHVQRFRQYVFVGLVRAVMAVTGAPQSQAIRQTH